MKLLIIEDNKEILNSLQTNLEEECFVVDTSEDGEEGSFLARTNNYDLIILDIMLPHKNGYQVCEEIRASGKTTPIIILSVESELQNKVDLLNLGADDYLTKPFALSELLARINAILRRPKEIENDILQLGILTMDTKRHTVVKEKKEIPLTRKEFMLLKYMIQNKGIVLTRGMIMEHVWNTDVDPFSNTIESHIVNLRKKIDSVGKKINMIKTIPGRGYKIDIK